MNEKPYSLVLISGRRTITVLEKPASEETRRLRICVDGDHRGDMILPSWYLPGYALTDKEILVWSGTQIYLLGFASPLRHSRVKDEVHMAYRLHSCWCLVCEISVLLWSLEDGVLAEAEHDEVLIDARWKRDILSVRDLRNRKFAIQIEEDIPLVSLIA